MKTFNCFISALFLIALNLGVMAGCSNQGVGPHLSSFPTDRSSDAAVPSEDRLLSKKVGNHHGTCTYFHNGSNGSLWKTKWC